MGRKGKVILSLAPETELGGLSISRGTAEVVSRGTD